MVVTDPIADMLTRIRNAITSKHADVEIPASKTKKAILDILVNEGYIAGYEVIEKRTARLSQSNLEVRPQGRKGYHRS